MMRRKFLPFCLLLLITLACGCTDKWANFARAERNLKNEWADYLIKVVDEDSAKVIVEGPLAKLKDKFEENKTRFEGFLKSQDLGQVDNALKQLKNKETGKVSYGMGATEKTFEKMQDGTLVIKGKFSEGSEQETIDTLSDPTFFKLMKAAEKRIDDQVNRISLIQPAGPSLQKVISDSKKVIK